MTPTPGSSQYGLALHASGAQLGLALGNGPILLRQEARDTGRELANVLQIRLGGFLAPLDWEELSYLSVSRGPGSFTSLRIGLTCARIIAQQFSLPLFTFSSLQAYAQFLQPETPLVAVTQTATQGKLYGGVYRIRGGLAQPWEDNPAQNDRLWAPAEWEDYLATLPHPPPQLQTPENLGETAPALLTLAWSQWLAGARPFWAEATPFYG
ncbi:MAG: tRNA (adenosine(37)-N6)-threonylcarbamoyltransferase complex dimerization subunit type 1 TsaB [Cyanobacteriota bacterium]|nr:tRNA (adenosine(37)-N6)-threonylcarbamoyltransferase complex dimerization subunit type 1 TsaB [Cyanobacteriota bacterium]